MFIGKAEDLGGLAQGAVCILCGREMVRDGMTVCCAKGHAEIHYHVLGQGGYITKYEAAAKLCEEGGHKAVWTGGFYEIRLNPTAEIPIARFQKPKEDTAGSEAPAAPPKPTSLKMYLICMLGFLSFSVAFVCFWYFAIDDSEDVIGVFMLSFLTIFALAYGVGIHQERKMIERLRADPDSEDPVKPSTLYYVVENKKWLVALVWVGIIILYVVIADYAFG